MMEGRTQLTNALNLLGPTTRLQSMAFFDEISGAQLCLTGALVCKRNTLVHWCAVFTNAIQHLGYFWQSFYRVYSFRIAKSNELRQIYTLISSVWTCTIEKLSSGSKYDFYK